MPTALSDRSASAGSSSSSSSSAHSLSSVDGECLYQLACVETFIPLSKDITPEDEPQASSHPVARIDYSANFKFIYGLYRSLRSHVDYSDTVAQQRGGDHTCQVIRALHTSPARWFLLLAFALRQCTANYTVWKDRRDVIMSPNVLQLCTRDALPALVLPKILLSGDAADTAAKAKALAEMEEGREKIQLVAQHWLPEHSDLYVGAIGSEGEGVKRKEGLPSLPPASAVSPWRAVRWELNAVGCFTRLYHKNFQVWHHRRELFSYALQQTTLPLPPPSSDVHVDPTSDGTSMVAGAHAGPAVLASEDAFSAYLERHHGLRFSDVDERSTVKAVLCEEDSKNYHAWLHLSWYLHALPFLLQPPSWASLRAFADTIAAASSPSWAFRVHPDWAYVVSGGESVDSTVPASRQPALPSSPLATEFDFTAQLIQVDCLNNSAWCHRYALFKEDLLRRLWREQLSCESGSTRRVSDEEFHHVLHALCMVEVDFALQWLHVDPTNESAYTHARSVAVLFHTLVVRWAVLRDVETENAAAGECSPPTPETRQFLRYLRDAPLCAPVAAAGLDLCASAEEGTVGSANDERDVLLQRMQRHNEHLSWPHYRDSFAVLRHMQRVLQTSIHQRVAELEGQAARVLRAAASPRTAPAKVALLNSLYERSSQYMLDNFHQLDAAQYHACQAVLEEMWVLYMTAAQRRLVRQTRPPEAYREGVKPEWVTRTPWSCEQASEEVAGAEGDEAVVAFFLHYEAAALNLAKRLTISDPIRFKYWKFEAMSTMQRSYEAV